MFLVEILVEFLAWMFIEIFVAMLPAGWRESLTKDAARAIVVVCLVLGLLAVLAIASLVITGGRK